MTAPTVYDTAGWNRGHVPSIAPDALLTPADAFFRRNHAEPPTLDVASFRLSVDGLVAHPRGWSLAELLATFPTVDVTASLVCAGLRRREFEALGPLNGELPWAADAASTGRWRGVRLADVLRAAGVTASAQHVHFTGRDVVERDGHTFGFGASIPLDKALTDDVLLATHLNDAPLTVAHGAPLRVIVPGWIGARSVKWLGAITVAEAPTENYFQRQAYRVERVARPDAPRDVSRGTALEGIARNCVIVSPVPGAQCAAGPLVVEGWAIGDSGRPVTAIECSVDGQHWITAEQLTPALPWCWVFWRAVVSIGPGAQTLLARASDAAGTMPAALASTWNVKGYANNAWYRTPIEGL